MNIFYRSFVAGILILAILMLRQMVRNKLPKKMFMVLWGIVMIRLLVPVSISIKVPGLFGRGAQNTCQAIGSRMEQSAVVIRKGLAYSKQADASFPIPIWYVLWGIGVAVLLGTVIVRYVRDVKELKEALPYEELNPVVTRLKRVAGVHKKVLLYQSEFTRTPVTYGIWKANIVFPKGMEQNLERQTEYMILHELVHIRRRDVVLKIVALFTLCMHWFNPMVWVMYYFFNRDIEISCDDRVLELIGGEEKEEYALTLIQMAERGSQTLAYCGFGKNLMEERIVSVMKHEKKNVLTGMIAVALVACTFTMFMNLDASDKKATSENKVLAEAAPATPDVKEDISDSKDKAEDVYLAYSKNDKDETEFKILKTGEGTFYLSEPDEKGKQKVYKVHFMGDDGKTMEVMEEQSGKLKVEYKD